MIPKWLAEQFRPYSDVIRGGKPFAELINSELGSIDFGALHNTAFILLRPDSLQSGQASCLLDALEVEHGIVPGAIRVLYVRPHLVDSLYRFKLPQWGENVWLH